MNTGNVHILTGKQRCMSKTHFIKTKSVQHVHKTKIHTTVETKTKETSSTLTCM